MADSRWPVVGDDVQLGTLVGDITDAATQSSPDSSWDYYIYLIPLFATSLIAVAMTWLRYRADISLAMQQPASLRRTPSRATSRHASPRARALKKDD